MLGEGGAQVLDTCLLLDTFIIHRISIPGSGYSRIMNAHGAAGKLPWHNNDIV